MPVHRSNIGEVVLNAWNDALQAVVEGNDRGRANRARSGKWIDSLARRFEEHYAGARYRVFWSGNFGNREQFGVNEFLFDIAVCSVSATKSHQADAQDLPFIARSHWQIESEFSRTNTRNIVVDMSKLVMGSAENKLFVASHRGDREAAVLDQVSEIAACCSGRVYFCFVSHPDDWKSGPERPALHEWISSAWVAVPLPPGA